MNSPAKWDLNDLLGIASLGALGQAYVPWSAWAMRPSAIATMVNEVLMTGRRSIVELGAGTSTVYLARVAADSGARVTSLEEDAHWALAVQGLIQKEGLTDVCSVHHVPLTANGIPGEACGDSGLRWPTSWYDAAIVREVCPLQIDLLIVDGPTAGDRPDEMVRAPAVPALGERLASQCTVVVDDVGRAAESAAASLWADQLGANLFIYERTGLGVLRRNDPRIIPTL